MEPLKDPCNDRVVTSIAPPPAEPLSEKLLYPRGPNSPPDWKVLKDHLFREGRLKKESVMTLIKNFSDVCGSEPNLLRLKDPVTVVGDIHGQFYDFVKLLEVGGDPVKTQYIFLGDYVDRGSFSIEVLLLLYALKLNFPKTIWMLRGNHECRQMTAFFNFRDECEYKYDQTVYYSFMESFDTLPVAATINGKFIAIHGGLSPEFKSLTQVHNLNRFQETPRSGLFCDLLWSDPVEEKEGEPPRRVPEPYVPNDVRGCSYFFAFEAATEFLDKNGLLSVIRAHEAQLEGYKMHRVNDKTGFPTVITIFSAPNYCDVYNNKGAVLKFENNTLNILQFNFSPHPYHLPNFMDVFTWTIPFVSEKVAEMLYYVLHPSTVEDGDWSIDDSSLDPLPANMMAAFQSLDPDRSGSVQLAAKLQHHIQNTASVAEPESEGGTLSPEKADRLRKKIRTVSRMMMMFKTLRQENETVLKLKGMCPGHRLSPGLLLSGKGALENELQRFSSVKQIDLENEKRPDELREAS